jgi:hypothetical protein
MLASEGHSLLVPVNTAGFMATVTGNVGDVDVNLFAGEILRLVGHEISLPDAFWRRQPALGACEPCNGD